MRRVATRLRPIGFPLSARSSEDPGVGRLLDNARCRAQISQFGVASGGDLGHQPAVHIDSSLFMVSRALGKVAASPLLFPEGLSPAALVERGDDVRGEHRHLADGRSGI
jgi:hypothetical protein